MPADTEHKTGKDVIQSLGKDVLLELYTTDDLAQDYRKLRELLQDPDISIKDFATLIKLLWDFTIERPKTSIEAKVTDGLNKLSDKELIELAKKKKLNASNRRGKESVGIDKVKTKNGS